MLNHKSKNNVKLRRCCWVSFLFLSCITLAGCNALAFLEANDPFQRSDIIIKRPENKTYVGTVVSLASNRRAIVIKPNHTFCAEPPPDVALSIVSEFEAKLKAAVEKDGVLDADATAKVLDKYQANVIKLADRTELLDVYRAGVYAICQYHLNGGIDSTQLTNMFRELTSNITRTLMIGEEGQIYKSAIQKKSE